MLEVSSGEFLLLAGVGVFFIGKKDIPRVSRALGDKVGRIVGLLQGARARGEQFARNSQDKELKSGLKELRAGLRELDAVKAELAVAASATTRIGISDSAGRIGGFSGNVNTSMNDRVHEDERRKEHIAGTSAVSGEDYLKAAVEHGEQHQHQSMNSNNILAPRSQSVAAVAEEEWVKQGIGFQSKAERVSWGAGSPAVGGSALLNEIISESLIHDQYDRVMKENEEMLRKKVEASSSKKSK